MPLSGDEKALYSELIVQIAARAAEVLVFADNAPENCRPRNDRFDFKSLVIDHRHETDFEHVCSALAGAGAIEAYRYPEDGKRRSWALYQFKFDGAGLRAHLERDRNPDSDQFTEAVEVYLRICTDYGDNENEWVSTRRDPFLVPQVYGRVFDLLARCGYVERVGENVKWTDKVAPMMQVIYAWNEDGVSAAERYDAEIEVMWQTMPPNVRDECFSVGEVDTMSLAIFISNFWYDGQWQATSRHEGEKEIILSGGAWSTAVDLERIYRETGFGFRH